ncbi:MAG TPA: hypothetical protein VMF32_27255, partial [Xanthobacteraceae bacterium]|nr:hypothetical protein [Xanthobacteraceae bacterium]
QIGAEVPRRAAAAISSGPILTFASRFGTVFANVGIKGPLANISAGGALDLTFASRICGQLGSECQIRSTGGSQTAYALIGSRRKGRGAPQ